MRWLESFTLLVKSSITTIRETVEDPERMLHQLIIDMEEELETVREGVASAIADEIQLGKQVERARQESQNWLDRATTALKRDDEHAAKAAIEQKVLAEQRADSLEKEHEEQKEQTARMQRSFSELEDKIRQARQRRTLLLARMARADSTRRINRAMDHAEGRSAFAQFNRLERQVERSEAMSDAYDRMQGRDPDAEELARKFQEDERKEKVQTEYEELHRHITEQSQ
jgi:phage shock protein A